MIELRTIADGVAYALWEHAWDASHASSGGLPWPPPAPVKKAARDLLDLYEKINDDKAAALAKTEGARDLGEFGDVLARAALGDRHSTRYQVVRSLKTGRTKSRKTIPAAAYAKQFKHTKVPTFEIELVGDDLFWQGGASEGTTYSPHEGFGRGKANPKQPHEVQHTKTVAETRRLIAKMDHCSKGCQGWDIFDTNRGFEIQVCDECNSSLSKAQQLADVDVAQLPEAKKALAEANETYAENPSGTKRFLVLMVNGDPKDTHAVELEGLTEEDFHEAIVEALDIANPDERDSIMYTTIESTDAGAARVDPRLQRQQWKLYKGAGPITTNPCGGRGGKR